MSNIVQWGTHTMVFAYLRQILGPEMVKMKFFKSSRMDLPVAVLSGPGIGSMELVSFWQFSMVVGMKQDETTIVDAVAALQLAIEGPRRRTSTMLKVFCECSRL